MNIRARIVKNNHGTYIMDRCLYYSRTVTCKLPEKVVYKSVNGPKTMETNGRERETQTWRNSWQLWVAKMPETELETTVVSCVQISRLSHTETREKANARVVLAINRATTQSWKISFFFLEAVATTIFDESRAISRLLSLFFRCVLTSTFSRLSFRS